MEGDKQYQELAQKLQKQSLDEIELDKKAQKKRTNISNLPADKLKKDTKEPPKSIDIVAKPGKSFFEAWDDKDLIEIDKTTEMVLAEKETFDILASRGYETLEEYPENGRKNRKL